MKEQWVLLTYWTPEGNEELVARVEDIEKDILKKAETDFIKLEYVRWIDDYDLDDDEADEIIEEAAAHAAECHKDDEHCCCCDEDEDIDEVIDEDEEDIVDDEILRLEDDFIYGTSGVMYLKRENIISVCPIKDEYAEFWNLTISGAELPE